MARWVCARGLRGQRLTEGQLDWVYRVTGGYGYTCFRPDAEIRFANLPALKRPLNPAFLGQLSSDELVKSGTSSRPSAVTTNVDLVVSKVGLPGQMTFSSIFPKLVLTTKD
jgi:hypothetical protein